MTLKQIRRLALFVIGVGLLDTAIVDTSGASPRGDETGGCQYGGPTASTCTASGGENSCWQECNQGWFACCNDGVPPECLCFEFL